MILSWFLPGVGVAGGGGGADVVNLWQEAVVGGTVYHGQSCRKYGFTLTEVVMQDGGRPMSGGCS